MVSILEKLSGRMKQRQSEQAQSWAGFVVAVVDEKLTNADEILQRLEGLNRSPEELQQACELLVQRRAWAAVANKGTTAESEYPRLTAQQKNAAEELERLIEQHNKKYAPLDGKIEQARNDITNGADARRRLLDTVPKAVQVAACADVDDRIQQNADEAESVRKQIREVNHWLTVVEERGASAAQEDLEKLSDQKARLKALKKQESELAEAMQGLQSERDAVMAKLLLPETL